ncbi:DUF1345 domain-containing protein [Brevibacterium sp.]|nr:DUF1345 domain-containing protein [Brevibacterium sp.]
MTHQPRLFWLRDRNRFAGACACGLAAALVSVLCMAAAEAELALPSLLTSALIGWVVFVGVHTVWVWFSVRGLSPEQTRRHAQREDPRRSVREALHVGAAVASVAGMGVMLLAADSDPVGRVLGAGLGLASVLGAWVLIQLMYMLRYAALYFEDDAGGGGGRDAAGGGALPPIDFHTDESPTYVDFAYFAFTVGVSFATSDSDVRTRRMRGAVLGQSLLSFFFGSIVIATATSLMLQLVGTG